MCCHWSEYIAEYYAPRKSIGDHSSRLTGRTHLVKILVYTHEEELSFELLLERVGQVVEEIW